jgi:hypothetical protein
MWWDLTCILTNAKWPMCILKCFSIFICSILMKLAQNWTSHGSLTAGLRKNIHNVWFGNICVRQKYEHWTISDEDKQKWWPFLFYRPKLGTWHCLKRMDWKEGRTEHPRWKCLVRLWLRQHWMELSGSHSAVAHKQHLHPVLLFS